MKIKNFKKLGISMVALVITIIVLIIITATVVITGIGAPTQAQLAVFYSNLGTVQDLVNIQMGNNMITAAQNGYGANYKWVGIATKIKDGTKSTYTAEDAINNEPINFERTVDGLDRDVVQISEEFIRTQTSLKNEEATKYYIDQQGRVYHQGLVIDGKTYYNKETINDASTQQGINELEGISAVEVAANPMSYYGAYVNYTDINGDMFTKQYQWDGTGEYPNDLEWRIFYSDGNNIYLTTKYIADYGSWYNREEAIEKMTEEKSTYVNEFYAEWSKDGITYDMLQTSYNQVKVDNPELKLEEYGR